uniref:Uncharacterized protein n=1 Tax=Strombidinopsis acuminata TaxID=141414 RepID=A0A7S3RV93_9SPIT|eukprot:scaffold60779_cov37-Tisochrysis_lutea.AAC.1
MANAAGGEIRRALRRCTRADLEYLLRCSMESGTAVTLEAALAYLDGREKRVAANSQQLFNERMRLGIAAAAILAAFGFILLVGDNDPDRWYR